MTSSYATIEGHKIFYSKGEEERGLPILFVHGVPTSSLNWLPVQRLLSPYLKTYRIDLIGMGKSDKPLQGWDYNFANDTKILGGLMDQLGYEKMIVAGDDWGGGIALTFASLYPNRTDLAIAVDPVAYDQWPVAEIETIGRMANVLDEKEMQKALVDFPMKFTKRIRSMLHSPGVLTARDMAAFREPYETVDYSKGGSQLKGDAGYGQLKLDAIKALAIRCASLNPMWMLDLDYSKIRSPVLILWGEFDPFMDPAARFRLKQDIVNASVRAQIVEEAGHLPILERPGFVAETILDFITEQRTVNALAKPYIGGLSEPEKNRPAISEKNLPLSESIAV